MVRCPISWEGCYSLHLYKRMIPNMILKLLDGPHPTLQGSWVLSGFLVSYSACWLHSGVKPERSKVAVTARALRGSLCSISGRMEVANPVDVARYYSMCARAGYNGNIGCVP